MKFLDFKIVERFKEIVIYQEFSITLVETNFMFVNATNVKSQENVFILDTALKSNKLTKMNFVIKSKVKRLTMNINKSSSQVILLKIKRDRLRKVKLSDEIKDTWMLQKWKT